MLKKLEMAGQAHMLVRTAQEHEEIRQAQAQLQLKIAAAKQEQAGLVAALSSLSQTNDAMLATTRCAGGFCCSRGCMQHVQARIRASTLCCSRNTELPCSPALHAELHLQSGKRLHQVSMCISS